jgi:hypothetical protein
MKDSIILLEKLNQIQQKINLLKANSEKLKNGIPFKEDIPNQLLTPKAVEPIKPIPQESKLATIPEPPSQIIKQKINTELIIPKQASVDKSDIVEENTEVSTISIFKTEPSIISQPTYIDVEADGYTIASDIIQLYNGNFLKCPSLTVAGSFSPLDKKNVWNFLDAESNIRGRLKKMSSFIELVLEPGKWTYFKCQGKIRVLVNVERERLYFNKQIVVAKGFNESKQPSELSVKSYNPMTMCDLNEGAVFILSFICTQSQILQIN